MEQAKKRLAVLVGCNYAGTSAELQGSFNNVGLMQHQLASRFGFQPGDVEVLTDAADAPVKPTGAKIQQALDRMLRRAEPGDVLLFFFSGQGLVTEDDRPAILPCDFKRISSEYFRQLVDRLPEKASLTVVADSCHSGGLIDNEKEQIGAGAGGDGGNATDEGILVSACRKREEAWEVKLGEKHYSAFVVAIVRVLSEGKGELSNGEMVRGTGKLLAEQGFEQHPCLYCSDDNVDAPFLKMD